MKSRVALIAAALLASAVAFAHPGEGRRGPDMDRMAVLLDLNDSQKDQVKKILDDIVKQSGVRVAANYTVKAPEQQPMQGLPPGMGVPPSEQPAPQPTATPKPQ